MLVATAMTNIAVLWILAGTGVLLDRAALEVGMTANGFSIALQLFVGVEAAANVSMEADVIAGFERAVETRATPVLVPGAIFLAATGSSFSNALTAWLCLGFVAIVAACAAIWLQPAVTTVAERMWSRRKTLEEH